MPPCRARKQVFRLLVSENFEMGRKSRVLSPALKPADFAPLWYWLIGRGGREVGKRLFVAGEQRLSEEHGPPEQLTSCPVLLST